MVSCLYRNRILAAIVLVLLTQLERGAYALAAEKGAQHALATLNNRCSDCHTGEKSKGQFRLNNLPADFTDPQAVRRWERILFRIEAGEMPPPDEDRPPAAEVDSLLIWAKTGLAAAAKTEREKAGRGRIRRLNRLEYENTLHDLLGIQTPLQDLLPADDTAHGFDTASSALSISPVHVQRYMDAAEKALKAALIRGPKPEPVTKRFIYEPDKEKYFMTHDCNHPTIRPRNTELLFFSEPHIEVPAQLTQFAALTKSAPGRYKVRVSAYAQDAKERSLAYLVRTTQSRKLLGYFDAPPEKPAVVEMEHTFGANDSVIVAPYRLNQARGESKLSHYPPKPWKEPEGLALAIQWVEVEGPLNDVWPPLGHQRMFGDVPLKPFKGLPKDAVTPGELQNLRSSDKLTPVSAEPLTDAKKLLANFLSRAFRRPVNNDDIQPYLEIVSKRLEQKTCFEASMLAAYQAALCSPDFLFLVEEPGALSGHALASRLSYFLWRTMPDDALRAAADKGELRRPEILRRETERLLSAPRASAFVADFLDHWLRLRDIDATTPDKLLFPEFYESANGGRLDGLLRESIVAETRLFFAELLKKDESLLNLIDSDFTFLNNRLAEHYSLPAVNGVGMQRVALPPGSVRGGVLTQASVLKVTANGSVTSPVLRGAWLLSNIIGREPPPPPPNVGSIEPDTRGATTIREQLAKHQNNQACASCHRQIDPPGFALECFDPAGRLRTFYRTTETGKPVKEKFFEDSHLNEVKYRQGVDVDPSGVTANGKKFSGPKEFKQIVLQQPDFIARNLAAKLIAYSTGQHTEPGDILALDALVLRVKKQKYGLRSLFHEIVQSEFFLTK